MTGVFYKVASISFVIENIVFDEGTLPALNILLLKFKNDDYDAKNGTRFAMDIDSRDNSSSVL